MLIYLEVSSNVGKSVRPSPTISVTTIQRDYVKWLFPLLFFLYQWAHIARREVQNMLLIFTKVWPIPESAEENNLLRRKKFTKLALKR